MGAILNCQAWQVIGFNKDGTQQRLCSAGSLRHLIDAYAREVARHESTGVHNILPTFTRIRVWSVSDGWGMELPYIQSMVISAEA